MQLILHIHPCGSPAAGFWWNKTQLLYPDTGAICHKTKTKTVFRDFSLDLTEGKGENKVFGLHKRFLLFFFLAEVFFHSKITSHFPGGSTHIFAVPMPLSNSRQNTGSYNSPLPLDIIHQQLCSKTPHNWFCFIPVSDTDTSCWWEIKGPILNLVIVPINLN